MPDNIRGIINVKTEGGKTLYKVKERSSTETRWIESTSSELSSKHILAFERKTGEPLILRFACARLCVT